MKFETVEYVTVNIIAKSLNYWTSKEKVLRQTTLYTTFVVVWRIWWPSISIIFIPLTFLWSYNSHAVANDRSIKVLPMCEFRPLYLCKVQKYRCAIQYSWNKYDFQILLSNFKVCLYNSIIWFPWLFFDLTTRMHWPTTGQ